jgi:hypothetical protein
VPRPYADTSFLAATHGSPSIRRRMLKQGEAMPRPYADTPFVGATHGSPSIRPRMLKQGEAVPRPYERIGVGYKPAPTNS